MLSALSVALRCVAWLGEYCDCPDRMPETEQEIRFALVGEIGVGKKSLSLQYIFGVCSPPLFSCVLLWLTVVCVVVLDSNTMRWTYPQFGSENSRSVGRR